MLSSFDLKAQISSFNEIVFQEHFKEFRKKFKESHTKLPRHKN